MYARPGSMTVMKNPNASGTVMPNGNAPERAASLVHAALDVLRRADRAPHSPLPSFLPTKKRRELRRAAQRLRRGQVEPRYGNLHSPEELADIYERAVQRDEIFERTFRDFTRISLDLGRILEENDPEVRKALDTAILELERSAEEQGPGSEAACRYWHLQFLGWWGQQSHSARRRQRDSAPPLPPLVTDPLVEARYCLSAAEFLSSSSPPGEAVVAIPPEGRDSGRERILIRIGLRESSWIGSFERGHTHCNTAFLMPDLKHLFVSADGAGYIIDLKSRTLVERLGTQVTGVMKNEARTVFALVHNGTSLEAFGRRGRLWIWVPVGLARIRRIEIAGDRIIGELWRLSPPNQVFFSIHLATGAVRVAYRREDAGARRIGEKSGRLMD